MHVLCHGALAMTIAGGVIIGSDQATAAENVDKINGAIKIRHIGVILFVVQYVLTASVTGYFWQNKHIILKNRRMVSNTQRLSVWHDLLIYQL